MGAALSRAIDNNGLEDEADRLCLASRLAEALQLAIE